MEAKFWNSLGTLPQIEGFPVTAKLKTGEEVVTTVTRCEIGWKLADLLLENVSGWGPPPGPIIVHSGNPDASKPRGVFAAMGSPDWFTYAESTRIMEQVSDERFRQIFQLGFTATHDDCHSLGQLIECAIAYANNARGILTKGRSEDAPWFQPSDTPERDLIKAAALLMAEVERRRRIPNQVTLLKDESGAVIGKIIKPEQGNWPTVEDIFESAQPRPIDPPLYQKPHFYSSGEERERASQEPVVSDLTIKDEAGQPLEIGCRIAGRSKGQQPGQSIRNLTLLAYEPDSPQPYVTNGGRYELALKDHQPDLLAWMKQHVTE